MKKCTQCGTVVSDFARIGERCPRCGLIWQAERQQEYSYAKPRNRSGCLGWGLLIFMIFIVPAILLPLRRSQQRSVVGIIAEQWKYVNTDSLNHSVPALLKLDSVQRIEEFNRAVRDYAGFIDNTTGEDKIRAISFVVSIDSAFKSACPYLTLFGSPLYYKLQEIRDNPDLIPQLKECANNTLVTMAATDNP